MFTNPEDVERFTFAGKAHLTLSSTKTGNHFTYRINKKKDQDIWFVSVLSGPDNENDYRYMGVLKKDGSVCHTMKSKISADAPSAKAFAFFGKNVLHDKRIPVALEVRHDNRCGCCHRKLTTPESVDRGIGPECWKRVCP